MEAAATASCETSDSTSDTGCSHSLSSTARTFSQLIAGAASRSWASFS